MLLLTAVAMAGSGCATTRVTARAGDSGLYAGTQLNMAAVSGNRTALANYAASGVEPPRYPWLDLPLSVVADTLIFVPCVMLQLQLDNLLIVIHAP